MGGSEWSAWEGEAEPRFDIPRTSERGTAFPGGRLREGETVGVSHLIGGSVVPVAGDHKVNLSESR